MCLIAFAWNAHPRYRFALVGNRDEAHARPTAPLGPHPQSSDVIGGRDLEKGGSWLLVSGRGRLAAVTNVRAGLSGDTAPLSRGALVDGFARSQLDAAQYLHTLRIDAMRYGRFNLLLWDGTAALLATNHPAFTTRALTPGVYGLSNGSFDADWPKVRRARLALQHWLGNAPDSGSAPIEPLFAALRDETAVSDADLPDTGIGLAHERLLAPPFIRGMQYGTRASSVVLIDDAAIDMRERRFGPDASDAGGTRLQMQRSTPPRRDSVDPR